MKRPFPSFSQDTRLLRITTPLGRDKILVECVRGDESLSRGYCFEVSVLSTDARIPLRSLLGQPALLELLTAPRKHGAPFMVTLPRHSWLARTAALRATS